MSRAHASHPASLRVRLRSQSGRTTTRVTTCNQFKPLHPQPFMAIIQPQPCQIVTFATIHLEAFSCNHEGCPSANIRQQPFILNGNSHPLSLVSTRHWRLVTRNHSGQLVITIHPSHSHLQSFTPHQSLIAHQCSHSRSAVFPACLL